MFFAYLIYKTKDGPPTRAARSPLGIINKILDVRLLIGPVHLICHVVDLLDDISKV